MVEVCMRNDVSFTVNIRKRIGFSFVIFLVGDGIACCLVEKVIYYQRRRL
jgi:hypothetical protein